MDLPNFFKYEIKDCSNKTSEDAPLEKDCWSFVEVTSWKKTLNLNKNKTKKVSSFTEEKWWPTWIAIRSIVIRIVPLLAIIVMNILIICKLRKIWKKKKSLFCATGELPSRTRMESTNGTSLPAISSGAGGPEVGLTGVSGLLCCYI